MTTKLIADPEEIAPSGARIVAAEFRARAERIARGTKFLLELFRETSARAAPRIRANQVASGPWRHHDSLSQHWAAIDAILMAESLSDTLVARGITPIGRPNAPVSKIQEAAPDSPDVEHHVGVEFAAGCFGIPVLPKIYFSWGKSAPYACARRSNSSIIFGRDFTRVLMMPENSRSARWYGEVAETFAHELTHLWQYFSWRASRLESPGHRACYSFGGDSSSYSPHGLRPSEVFATACGHAAWLAKTGEYPLLKNPQRLIAEMSLPDTAWRNYWVDWRDPEYISAFPQAGRAARMYHRVLRYVLPVFVEILNPDPPVLHPIPEPNNKIALPLV